MTGEECEFLLRRWRDDKLGESEAGTNRLDGIDDRLQARAQVHEHVGVNGDERSGQGGHRRA